MSARYHAPAVTYAFARPAWAGWALLVIWLALLAAMLAWNFQSQVAWLRGLVAFAALSLAAGLLRRQWQHWPQGKLLWNGENWSIRSEVLPVAESQVVQLRIGLDGASWMWVRVSGVLLLNPISGKRKVLWIFIAQQHSPVQWGDLRRAVYSSIAPLKEQG